MTSPGQLIGVRQLGPRGQLVGHGLHGVDDGVLAGADGLEHSLLDIGDFENGHGGHSFVVLMVGTG